MLVCLPSAVVFVAAGAAAPVAVIFTMVAVSVPSTVSTFLGPICGVLVLSMGEILATFHRCGTLAELGHPCCAASQPRRDRRCLVRHEIEGHSIPDVLLQGRGDLMRELIDMLVEQGGHLFGREGLARHQRAEPSHKEEGPRQNV
jgi:hypothetical protein